MRKHYTAAFKAQVVREILREDKPISQIASEHGVHPNVLHNWKAQALEGLPRVFEGRDDVAALRQAHEREKHELYAEIGRLATHVAWLKRKAGLEHDPG
jgi:transposase-like protein